MSQTSYAEGNDQDDRSLKSANVNSDGEESSTGHRTKSRKNSPSQSNTSVSQVPVAKQKNDYIKVHFANNGFDWDDIDKSKFGEFLVSRIPFLDAQSSEAKQHYPVNFYLAAHSAGSSAEDVDAVVADPKEIGRLKFYQKKTEDLAEGDVALLLKNVIQRDLSKDLLDLLRNSGAPIISIADGFFLVCCSEYLSKDCEVHFSFERGKGMVRCAMIQNNSQVIIKKLVCFFTGTDYRFTLEAIISSVSLARLEVQLAVKTANQIKRQDPGDKPFEDDQPEHFTSLMNSGGKQTFKPTQRIQLVPAHKSYDGFETHPCCQDLYLHATRGHSLIQLINFLLYADTPEKHLEFGIKNTNALVMMKLMQNPNAATDGSVEFFCEQMSKFASVDMNHFVELVLATVCERDQDQKISAIQGEVKIQPFLILDFHTKSGFSPTSSLKASAKFESALEALYDLYMNKLSGMYYNELGSLRYETAARELRIVFQEIYCLIDQSRTVVDVTLILKKEGMIFSYQHILSSREHVKFSDDTKVPSLDADKKVWGKKEGNVFNVGSSSYWTEKKVKKTESSSKEKTDVDILLDEMIVLDSERLRYKRFIDVMLSVKKFKNNRQGAFELVKTAKLERIQAFQVVFEPVTANKVDQALQTNVFNRLFNGEFLRHPNLRDRETQKKLIELLQLKNKALATVEDFKSLMSKEKFTRSVSNITASSVNSLFTAITDENSVWKNFLKTATPVPEIQAVPKSPINIKKRSRVSQASNRQSSIQLSGIRVDNAYAVNVIYAFLQSRTITRSPLSDIYSRAMCEMSIDSEKVSFGLFYPMEKLQVYYVNQSRLESQVLEKEKWCLDEAVLLLPVDFFDIFLEQSGSDLLFFKPILDGAVRMKEFLQYAVRVIQFFLRSRGISVADYELEELIKNTGLVGNFLKRYTGLSLRNDPKFVSCVLTVVDSYFTLQLTEDMNRTEAPEEFRNLTENGISGLLLNKAIQLGLFTQAELNQYRSERTNAEQRAQAQLQTQGTQMIDTMGNSVNNVATVNEDTVMQVQRPEVEEEEQKKQPQANTNATTLYGQDMIMQQKQASNDGYLGKRKRKIEADKEEEQRKFLSAQGQQQVLQEVADKAGEVSMLQDPSKKQKTGDEDKASVIQQDQTSDQNALRQKLQTRVGLFAEASRQGATGDLFSQAQLQPQKSPVEENNQQIQEKQDVQLVEQRRQREIEADHLMQDQDVIEQQVLNEAMQDFTEQNVQALPNDLDLLMNEQDDFNAEQEKNQVLQEGPAGNQGQDPRQGEQEGANGQVQAQNLDSDAGNANIVAPQVMVDRQNAGQNQDDQARLEREQQENQVRQSVQNQDAVGVPPSVAREEEKVETSVEKQEQKAPNQSEPVPSQNQNPTGQVQNSNISGQVNPTSEQQANTAPTQVQQQMQVMQMFQASLNFMLQCQQMIRHSMPPNKPN